jgi:serine/threonine protein kinase
VNPLIHTRPDGKRVDLRQPSELTSGAERYQSLTTLGKGGMGEVRLCKDHNLARNVAMKVMREGVRPSGATLQDEAVVRFVREVLVTRTHPDPVPVVLTCGSAEENVHNNRLMASALTAQGYPVELYEVPDMHNYTAWRDALDPYLPRLLERAW